VTTGVSVLIINRDLLTWPRAMVERIEKFDGLAEIIILDNGSTYAPLLDWYKSQPYRVIFADNLGHAGPWLPEINSQIGTDFYVVTDPDLDLEAVPLDCLVHLRTILARHPSLGKVGLGLEIDNVPQQSPYYQHVNGWERHLWQLPLYDGQFRLAPVDTTFAIYNKTIFNQYGIGGARTTHPYVAKHIPWMLTELPDEFRYYLDRASASSSYKTFVGYVPSGHSPD
jgi:hypothetical protein